MDHSPHAPRPKPIPPHLVNGHSPLHPRANGAHSKDERDSTFASIKSSMGPKKEPLDLENPSQSLNSHAPSSSSSSSLPNGSQQQENSSRQYEEVQDNDINHIDLSSIDLKVAARDGRDEAPQTPLATARSNSPFTQNPTIDFEGLSWPSVGTLSRLQERESPADAQARLEKLSGAVRTILECIGEDPDREGLHGTPERYAKAMMFFTKGYEENLRDIVNGAVFHEDHDELVIVRDIEVYSLCEHHLVPFTGKVGSPLLRPVGW